MPHVIVKLWPGKSEQKTRLAVAITKDVTEILGTRQRRGPLARGQCPISANLT
jgi:phenylpyruvate tautomerase PptA (4-oxalocrotonate tautomerase family)